MPNGVEIDVFHIYPISPKRVLLIVGDGAEAMPQDICGIDVKYLRKSSVRLQGGIDIPVRKMYKDEVAYINGLLIDNASEGVVFKGERNKSMLCGT